MAEEIITQEETTAEPKKKKKTLNPKTDIPTSKTEITQDFMLGYVLDVHPEDKAWFGKLIMDNQKEMKNNLTKATYMGIDLATVRTAFCEKYFPSLNFKKNYNEDKKSYLDLVKELCLGE